MHKVRFTCLALAVCCLMALGVNAVAPEVDSDAVYCFTGEEFSQEEKAVVGICITGLPEASAGTVLLGNRVLRPGDILTADQLTRLTFNPLQTQQDSQATISYLPIYENRVEKETAMTIGIRGKEDKAPVAEDFALETYKNLPNEGKLKVTDPEGKTLTYTVVRGPKRGTVEVDAEGNFTYTPKKNKVGVDSFTYTATDPAGNVSRVATVTVQILKPTDARQYTDTVGQSCRFEAEWMRNTGLFVGEQIGGNACFYPDKAVSRQEFLTMVVKVLDIPLEDAEAAQLPENTPQWLKPYLAAAQRSGLTANWQTSGALDEPITGAEVAVILQNALDLSATTAALENEQDESVPTWAAASLTVLAENGLALDANGTMTRGEIAETLYQVSQLALEAPGMTVIRMQQ